MSITINSSAPAFTVNRYSDFKLVLSVLKDGEAYVPESFMMVFYVDTWDDCAGRYTASRIDGVCTHCEVDNTTISIFFDAPGFNLGTLKCRLVDMVENANYDDGTLDTCTPITLPVEIVAGAGNTDTIVLGYGEAYFGDNHDLVFDGPSTPSFGTDNNLEL